MSEERLFLKAIKNKPDDRTARLVYADWLQERDDERGELIRIEEELPTLPIHSDRYWELKPRRRTLLKAAEKPWLMQMGYGSTDYQPVFADVPTGWKERWRLLREFVERWYRIPMQDVGGPLKLFPKAARKRAPWVGEAECQSVDDALSHRKVRAGLPPSLREWMLFIRELQLGLNEFGRGTGDDHNFTESPKQIDFFQQQGYRECFLVRNEDRKEPDPQVWQSSYGDEPECVSPHVTTLALHYLLTQYEPQFGEPPAEQRMTQKFARRLAKYFPVRSNFDETQIYERSNVIALWIPKSPFTGNDPCIHVKARSEADRAEVHTALWE
ncbi:MAG: TIGR02996 domain-containing protein [Planctomycetes bacterium]|nr:TIGR02996 domain-containing protein [Planctomycetota bacterium]